MTVRSQTGSDARRVLAFWLLFVFCCLGDRVRGSVGERLAPVEQVSRSVDIQGGIFGE